MVEKCYVELHYERAWGSDFFDILAEKGIEFTCKKSDTITQLYVKSPKEEIPSHYTIPMLWTDGEIRRNLEKELSEIHKFQLAQKDRGKYGI